jgi:hypothetical protein
VQSGGKPQTVATAIVILNAQHPVEEVYGEDVNTYNGHGEAGQSS